MDSKLIGMIKDVVDAGKRRGLLHLDSKDEELDGRSITLDGRPVTSFSSCSYLGLEFHPALVDGVAEAVKRYGTQFSCSRAYVSNPLYAEVEALLSELFGGYALVTPTTTLGHLTALPVLADERDAIVLDHQVHHSVHLGANQARAGGTRVELVRHDHLDQACDTIRQLANRHRTVWFGLDGVYSMFGDMAPTQLLEEILAVAPNVRLYVDDAHGMSWAGRHGRGSFLSRFPLNDRVVIATSLNKGFGAGGGCLVFSDPEERDLVRTTGGPLIFSGPMQPPMMGAVRAAALIHLSPEIIERQAALRAGVDRVNTRLCDTGLPPMAVNESPIFFLQCGLPRVVYEVAKRMLDDGLYVNCSVFPSVPMKRGGIRLSVTAAHTLAEIDQAIDRLAFHIPAVLRDFGVADGQLADDFANAIPREAVADTPPEGNGLRMKIATSIHQIDRATWDAVLGDAAHCSWDAMAAAEAIYGGENAAPEHRWRFRYLVIRDRSGQVVSATFLTALLSKDDMLSAEDVSREIEERRATDPYYLTSKVIMAGSTLSEGNHIYLDRTGPWRDALRMIVAAAEEEAERCEASTIMLRDFPDGDTEMDAFMLDEGFAKVPILDTHTLALDGADEKTWYAGLDKKKRNQLRPALEHVDDTEVSFHGTGLAPLTTEETVHLHDLFEQLAARKLRINVFRVPPSLLPEMLCNPSWELGVVRIRADAAGPQQPVAFWAAHKHGHTYAPLLCGLDDAWRHRDIYRLMLLQLIRRARALSMRKLRLGMDGEIEKRRLGARTERICLYVRTSDDYHGALLNDTVAAVATSRKSH
ncbi:bifunctional aminotransferase class I/II-fold pyridoxal phosphate-dependent enzyme/GNAT family N-acetyltransferase [Mycobacterium spongiae]|uniref:8-amino-7-oxononanoate synthase n=1 Tax=Mycobacterium spongiae TaxID=886343 RepID=A0A975JWL0_9MYCO|nr:bifunctional aminotransferase class I/II-fold pyridoxal phosphate-dependent enzyme/GNAT family N-acetyltransferase [Mycobacterium spongiae]QUR67037.1 aminotransferase class I/II-fold pyridoxal phosphate-dependent enzyme [Mycobacterium spongiae]